MSMGFKNRIPHAVVNQYEYWGEMANGRYYLLCHDTVTGEYSCSWKWYGRSWHPPFMICMGLKTKMRAIKTIRAVMAEHKANASKELN